jgi:hypothetical protein
MGDLRVGLVGAGWIARKHVETLEHLGGTQIVAVCDVDPERAKAVTGATAYDSWEDLLERETLDVLFICTPRSRIGSRRSLPSNGGSTSSSRSRSRERPRTPRNRLGSRAQPGCLRCRISMARNRRARRPQVRPRRPGDRDADRAKHRPDAGPPLVPRPRPGRRQHPRAGKSPDRPCSHGRGIGRERPGGRERLPAHSGRR